MTACPIQFPYEITALNPRRVRLRIDACAAEIIDAKTDYYFQGGEAWGDAVKLAQILRDEFHASWADAHGETA